MDSEECRVAGMTVRIDRLLCVGFETCIEVAPDLFDLDEEGIAVFRENIDGVNREDVLGSCRSCPVDALEVFDIHLHITTGSANADDFMPTRQGVYGSFANGAGGTHDNYFHHPILPEACMEMARRIDPEDRMSLECGIAARGAPRG